VVLITGPVAVGAESAGARWGGWDKGVVLLGYRGLAPRALDPIPRRPRLR